MELDIPIYLAARPDTTTLISIGVLVTCVVSMLTFSNWRLGVKIAFVVVLIEGAIRKWFLPGAQELAYFAKDIFLIGAYLRFFFFPDPELRAWNLRVPGGLFMVLCVIVSFSALNPNIGSPILAAYGVKIYMFYLPLGFMVPFLFRSRKEMADNLFWYAMMATPICLLGTAQYALPGDNFLNVMAGGEEGTTFGWAGARIRVTGTFSYITGHTTFVVIFTALHLGLLLNRMPKWRFVCLVSNLPLLAANALMSGSRGAVLSTVVIGGLFLIASMLDRIGDGSNAILKIGTVGALAMAVISLFFTHATSEFKTRVEAGSDTIYYRAVKMSLGSIQLALEHGGLTGLGIGMSHPALEKLRSVLKIPRPKKMVPSYDAEQGQVLVELGLIGWIAWYVLRFSVLYLTFKALSLCEPGLTKSMVLTSLIIQIPHMQFGVVLNHTANFLVFGLFGLAMVAMLKPAVTRRFPQGMPSAPTSPQIPVPATTTATIRGSKWAQPRVSR